MQPADLLGKLVSLDAAVVHQPDRPLQHHDFPGAVGARCTTRCSKKDGDRGRPVAHQRKDNEIYAETLGEQLDDPSQKFSSEGLEPSKDPVAALLQQRFAAGGESARRPAGAGATPDGTHASGNGADARDRRSSFPAARRA